MATINLYTFGIAHGNEKIRYALSKQLPGDPVSSELCDMEAETVIQQFAASRDAHDSKCAKPIAEMIHSFSPEESKRIGPELVNKLGHEVATTMFPGHQALVVTHLDRGHLHNHIILNRHHFQTGKLTRDDFRTLKRLRETNDRICCAHGLSIPNEDAKEREARVPKVVAQMIKHGRASYIADTMQKADFARSIATSYDQYQGIMAEFGITVRIERKNISYSYPGRAIAKRGKTMGALYDTPGLEKAFKANDERFQKNPALRDMLASHLRQIKATPGVMKGLAAELAEKSGGHFNSGVKDYSKHEIVPRREARWARASEEELTLCLVPIDEMRKARRANIVSYCRDNGIKLDAKSQSTYVLAGRSHVEVSDYEWRNTKNNTRGSLIDLVAAHKQISFLAAIAEINGNKRLLLLQREMGEVKRTYTSFYVPKGDQDHSPNGREHLARFLSHHSIKPDHAPELARSGQVHISAAGVIRFFGKDDKHGTIEFAHDGKGEWSRRERGQFTRPFFAMGGNGRKLNVYLDPFSFLRAQAKRPFPEKKESDDILALMRPNSHVVDQFLSGHRSVDTLRLVTADPAKPTTEELDFFNTLKTRYQQYGIAIEFISIEKTMPGRGRGLELSL